MRAGQFKSMFFKKNEIDSGILVICIHGFGESGQSFDEIFESDLAKKYSLVVPDLPGFGFSKLVGLPGGIEETARFLEEFLLSVGSEKNIIIVAHSMGAAVACFLAEKLGDRVRAFISIEGFLIADKKRYSSRYSLFSDPEKFKQNILESLAKSEECSMIRYRLALTQANAAALFLWARSCYELAADSDVIGRRFLDLKVRKIYLFGGRSLDSESRDFLSLNNVDVKEFIDSGHWLMEEQPDVYKSILEFLEKPLIKIK